MVKSSEIYIEELAFSSLLCSYCLEYVENTNNLPHCGYCCGQYTIAAKFKTLTCESFYKEYSDFILCDIKTINPNKNIVNINYRRFNWNYLSVPMPGILFLYNFKFNLCLKKNHNVILRMGYNYMKSFTNLNHSCPIKADEELKLVNYSIDIEQLRIRFPIENGEYAMHLSWFHHKKLVVTTNVSIEYFDHRNG